MSRLQGETGFTLGRASEITRDELKFNKFIQRVQRKFSQFMIDILRVQLISKGVMTDEDFDEARCDIRIDFLEDNHFTELKNNTLNLNDKVLVSKKAWKTGGSKMFIDVGKKIKVKDILQGVITVSGNDASVALAEHISGDEKTFSTYMNQMATNLGLSNTNYTNSTGLPSDSLYTTAEDISILSRALIAEFPDLYKLYSTKSFEFNEIKQ